MICIGLMGEQNARTAEIDVSEYLARWPGTLPQLFVIRPGETDPYIAATTLSGSTLIWAVNAYDTEIRGVGRAQILFIRRDAEDQIIIVGKAPVDTVTVGEALEGTEGAELPDPYDTWAATIAAYAADAYAAQLAAEDAADRAEQCAANAGYMDVDIVDGRLIYTRTDTIDIDLEIVNGNLIVMEV